MIRCIPTIESGDEQQHSHSDTGHQGKERHSILSKYKFTSHEAHWNLNSNCYVVWHSLGHLNAVGCGLWDAIQVFWSRWCGPRDAAQLGIRVGECTQRMQPRGYGCWYYFNTKMDSTLYWRHSDHGGVSNHQPHGCLLNRLFRRRSKKTSKLRVAGLCAGNSPWPVKSPHKGPVTRKMFPFDDVIMFNTRMDSIKTPTCLDGSWGPIHLYSFNEILPFELHYDSIRAA